jgi:hypothetical protein
VVRNFENLISKGLEIVELGEKKGATLRLMGGVAIMLHTTNNAKSLFERFGRSPGDLDFVAFKKESRLVKQLMMSLEYQPNQMFNAMHGHKRQLWYSKEFQIDILLDIFEMCHVIEMKDRLKLDKPTITPSDLFLQKIQIVKINEKDVKDLMILLLGHDLGETDEDKINLAYISGLLSKDWGFWYTTQSNLGKILQYTSKYAGTLNQQEQELIRSRVLAIQQRLNSVPKSFAWKMREKVGTKTPWYKDVEEVER